MTSEVVGGHAAECCSLLLVALEHSDQAQNCKDGTVCETNIRGGDGALCLELLDGRVISAKLMIGHGAGCCGLILLEVVVHDDSAQEHGDCTIIRANLEEVGGAIMEDLDGPT